MADQSVELEQVGAAEAAQAPQVADGRLITMLVDRARSEGLQLTGGGGLLQQLTKRVLGSALEGEITDRLGCDKREAAGRNSGNSRSGTRSKTVLTDVGPVGIKVPRDLTGTCGPQIVKKRQRRLTGACEMVLCLSAKGLTHGGIAARLAEVYGAEVSKQTISTITGKAMDGMAEWRSRPLGRVYPVLFVEAVNVRIRDGQAANRPVCVALAVTVEGRRDIPGIRAGDGGEGAKYWLHVFTELKNRGLQDVLMLVCDGLEGLPEAVETVRPRTIVQTCVIHLLRNGFRCAGRQDWDKIAKKPKPVCTAPDEAAATARFTGFPEEWGAKYPAIVRLREDAWAEFVPFPAFDAEIRKVICPTNAIESVNARIRKAVRARGHFPNEQAAMKRVCMALMPLDPTGKDRKRWTMRWKAPLNAFQIHFEGRLTPATH